MFEKDINELKKMGADITTIEIKQQPDLWEEAFVLYKEKKDQIDAYLKNISDKSGKKIRVIFTGAGTSQYCGDTVVPYLRKNSCTKSYSFESLATTDIVASPEDYLLADETTVLVSFARSGNSPESIAAVKIANQVVKDIYHIYITCAPEGTLAQTAKNLDNVLVLLMPSRSNDKGFAMTGSFSCMSLTALLIFDVVHSLEDKEKFISIAADLGRDIVARENEVLTFMDKDFDRIVYVGSGALAGLSREAQLKVLELTAGKVSTIFDSSMGFRHGPKSFINGKTLFFTFVNNDKYTKQYDLDILNEVHADNLAAGVLAIGQAADEFKGQHFAFKKAEALPEGYLALPCIMVAQTVSLNASIGVNNTPDTPSPTGTVNRVVQGVTIHEYK